jgi:acyl dehydratase
MMLTTDYSPLIRGSGHIVGFHARHQARFLRPAIVGDTLTVDGTVSDKFRKRGLRYYTLTFTAQNQSGEPVYVQHNTMTVGVLRRRYAADEEADRSSAPKVRLRDEHTLFERILTQEEMIRFATLGPARWYGATAPRINSHTDPDFARSAGLPATNAQALHYLAWASDKALEEWNMRWLRGGNFDARFFRVVVGGDTVTVKWGRGMISGAEVSTVTFYNQRQELVALATVQPG